MIRDMTKGNTTKIIFLFALPMVLGNAFQQFYNIADSIVVGNFVGADALAAVGASFPIVFLSIAVSMGASMGCSVVISQLFGAKQIEDVKSAITTAIIFVTLLGMIFSIFGISICRPILKLLQTPENIFANSALYLKIIFLGSTFQFMYNILTSIFNSLGDSKTPLKCLILATVVNITLDLLFVIQFNMEVAGVAWATIIAQVASAVCCFILLMKRIKKLEVIHKVPLFRKDLLSLMIKYAIPSTLQQAIVSVGMMAVQGLVNSYGSVVIAGYTAATKIDSIAMMPMMNISAAVSTFSGQNMGAGDPERVKQGFRSAIIITLGFCIPMTLILYIFGPHLIALFVDSKASQDVIQVGMEYLKVVSLFYILMGVMFIANGVLRGTGDIKFSVVTSFFNLTSRVIAAYTLAMFMDYDAIWWSIPIGWGIAALIGTTRYRSGRWKDKGIVKIEGTTESVSG